MATSYEDSVEEDLICPLCFELFVDPNTPKELDCPHIQCLVCLERITDGYKPTIECPECRENTNVPPEGVSALKTNLRIRSLAQKHFDHTHQKKSSSVKQQVDCGGSGGIICPDHAGEKVHFFCNTCKMTACQACIVLKHEPRSRHDIKDINQVHAAQQEEMKMILVKADKDATQWEKAAITAEDEDENYKLLLMMEEQKIDTIVASVQEQGRALKEELSNRSAEYLENYQKHRDELLQTADEIRTAAANAKKILQTASCHDYVAQHDKIATGLIKKSMGHPPLFEEKYKKPETLKFTPNPSRLLLGSLEAEPSPDQKPKNTSTVHEPTYMYKSVIRTDEPIENTPRQQDKPKQLKLFQEIKDFKRELSGIAVGQQGTLSICSKYQGLIQIYKQVSNSQKYRSEGQIKLPIRAWGPHDLTVAGNGDHLVARMECIEIYNKSGLHKGDIHTHTSSDDGSFGVVCITMTQNGQIVVGDRDLQHITVHHSSEFSTFKIGVAPDRLAPIKNTQVAIASRDKGVCIVDLKSGRKVLSMSILKAYGICYDQTTNCLFVGRQDDSVLVENRGVIEQYSCVSGKKIARIAHGLMYPRAMTFLPDGRLAVAEENTIKIYNVT